MVAGRPWRGSRRSRGTGCGRRLREGYGARLAAPRAEGWQRH